MSIEPMLVNSDEITQGTWIFTSVLMNSHFMISQCLVGCETLATNFAELLLNALMHRFHVNVETVPTLKDFATCLTSIMLNTMFIKEVTVKNKGIVPCGIT